jgi:hypothetical protein
MQCVLPIDAFLNFTQLQLLNLAVNPAATVRLTACCRPAPPAQHAALSAAAQRRPLCRCTGLLDAQAWPTLVGCAGSCAG